MLTDIFNEICSSFVKARSQPFSDHPLATKIRRDLVDEAKKKLIFRNEDYIIKGSPGAGNWAAVPWLGIFDPLITKSAQQGFYIVYLFNVQDEEITLSLNQGATAAYREFGQTRGREVLRRRAEDIRARVNDFSNKLTATKISLGSTESLPLGYEAGHALGTVYNAQKLDERAIVNDLEIMLDCYQALIQRGGLIPTDLMIEEAGGTDIEETRRYILSRRIERSPNVRRHVLSAKPPECEVCGLRPFDDYRFNGKPEEIPLDVHHLNPLYTLSENETKRYRIPEDFAVLCPTCHRMIHKLKNPSDTAALKRRIRFKHMREIY